MRAQYHSRKTKHGVLVWDVHRLIRLSKGLKRELVPLASIREIDETYWDDGANRLTSREIVDHARLMAEADLAHPIILSHDGRVMDGMHRVGRALLEGRASIEAVRFESDPKPDYIDVDPDTLPYVDRDVD